MDLLGSLDFEDHQKHYEQLFGVSDVNKEYALRQAKASHSEAVFNPLRDCYTDSIQLSYELKNTNARYYLRHGAARRLQMIWQAYRELIFTVGPEREQPLTTDEVLDTQLNLNTFYMHIRGTLDNFAWCILNEVRRGNTKGIRPMSVELFSETIFPDPEFQGFANAIAAFSPWNAEVKKRRDPVAHRIPLSMPPAFISPEEEVRYRETQEEYGKALFKADLDATQRLSDELDSIGTFDPYIVHHPDEGLTPLFPTLASDASHIVKIYQCVGRYLRSL